MTTPLPSLDHAGLVQLLRQAQAGCDASAELLFQRCREPLLAVIRKVIDQPLRRLYDSDDFLVDTFSEIFQRHFTESVLQSPATLWPYLKRIAENKVLDARRKYLLAQRHNLRREVSMHNLAAESDSCLCSHELQPEETLMLKELVEERLVDLISQLPSMLQEIIGCLLKGEGGVQIAHRLSVEPKRVYRAMEWLKAKILDGAK